MASSSQNPLVTVKIGTRKSQLAMIQTDNVKSLLMKCHPNLITEIVAMSTKGDEVLDRALFKIGDKSLFTKELENALLDGKVDIVVHSLKDLPSVLPDGLVIGAVIKREDPSDAVVIKEPSKLKSWSEIVTVQNSVIGTSSVRRAAQLRASYPNLKFEDVRGNLNTRLKKLDDPNGRYTALVLASAGLNRMGWGQRLSHRLDIRECLPAVGQGAIAVECRGDDLKTLDLLCNLNDFDTVLACVAERALMRTLDGGCSAPVAAHANIENDKINIEAGVWSLDGTESIREVVSAQLDSGDEVIDGNETKISAISVPKGLDQKNRMKLAHKAGVIVAENLLAKGAGNILKTAKDAIEKAKNNEAN